MSEVQPSPFRADDVPGQGPVDFVWFTLDGGGKPIPAVPIYKVAAQIPVSCQLLYDTHPELQPWRERVAQGVRLALHRWRRRHLPWLDYHWHDDRWLPHQHEYGRGAHAHVAQEDEDDDD